MFDTLLRRPLDPLVGRLARHVAALGIGADALTFAGLAVGVGASAAIVAAEWVPALLLIVLSRLLDGLDGAVARLHGPTDFGGYLDIVADFAFYGLVPAAFAWQDPATNALPAAVLLLSFYINGASFLAFAALAAKRGLSDEERGPKSIHFTAGLAEAGETYLAFALFCLFPGWFGEIAYMFAALCLVTALSRVWLARRTFRG